MKSGSFTEFEAYAEAIRDVQLDVRLLRLYERRWSIRQLELNGLHIQNGVEGSGMLTEGTVTPEGWGLYIPDTRDPFPVNGQRIHSEAIAILPPRAEFRLAGQGPINWISIFIPNTALKMADSPVLSLQSADVICPGRKLVRRLTRNVHAFLQAADQNPHLVSEASSVNAFEQEISSTVHRILGVVDSLNELKRTTLANRRRLVAIAETLINDRPELASTVHDVAKCVGISDRTLLTVFREHLGVTPQQYLIANRLHQARRILKSSDRAETTVAKVAAEVGFWDFGRFSRKNQTLFGELPSETLHQRVGRLE
ncbi:MAG: helix-turn-helix domain-containing protein [Planctomycetaceae bacterium]|nr:helix-turn-helix domain-containing protein [Planctomycetaceae bacterium]